MLLVRQKKLSPQTKQGANIRGKGHSINFVHIQYVLSYMCNVYCHTNIKSAVALFCFIVLSICFCEHYFLYISFCQNKTFSLFSFLFSPLRQNPFLTKSPNCTWSSSLPQRTSSQLGSRPQTSPGPQQF